jgi:Leucine-rich repeat (LRR) protein
LLGLAPGTAAGAIASLNAGDDGAVLNLFDGTGGPAGLGPFESYDPPPPAATVSLPGLLERVFQAADEAHAIRLEVDSAARVVLWSEGGPETAAFLYAPDGLLLGENRRGAPDGNGFEIVRTLAAGRYDLLVKTLSGADGYTLHVEEAGAIPFSDDALAACAMEAGWSSGAGVEELICRNRGVESLVGLETLFALKRLALGGNRISDLSPLQGLLELRELSLDGNLVSDLSPLGALASLERLSLTGNPIDPAHLTLLADKAATLSHLDLTGVPTLSGEAAAALRQTPTHLVLILPDGTVMD